MKIKVIAVIFSLFSCLLIAPLHASLFSSRFYFDAGSGYALSENLRAVPLVMDNLPLSRLFPAVDLSYRFKVMDSIYLDVGTGVEYRDYTGHIDRISYTEYTTNMITNSYSYRLNARTFTVPLIFSFGWRAGYSKYCDLFFDLGLGQKFIFLSREKEDWVNMDPAGASVHRDLELGFFGKDNKSYIRVNHQFIYSFRAHLIFKRDYKDLFFVSFPVEFYPYYEIQDIDSPVTSMMFPDLVNRSASMLHLKKNKWAFKVGVRIGWYFN